MAVQWHPCLELRVLSFELFCELNDWRDNFETLPPLQFAEDISSSQGVSRQAAPNLPWAKVVAELAIWRNRRSLDWKALINEPPGVILSSQAEC